MILSVAGLRVAVAATGPMVADHVAARFGRYEVSDDGRAADLNLSITVDPAWVLGEPMRNRFPGVDVRREPDGTLRFLRPDGETRVHLGRHRTTAFVRPTGATDVPMDDVTPIDTPLRLQLATELPSRQGAMVHACGYADDRGAVLFIARSGGGKTTTARKLPEGNVLSDDLVAVRHTSEGWDALSLPFVGEWRRPTTPRRAKLRALVFLRKADAVSVGACTAREAFAETLQSMVWFAQGDPAAASLLDHAHDLTRTVPCVTLGIPRDAPVLSLLDRWLA